MRYIVRTLRFEDGEWDKSVIAEGGYANWRVVSVLNTHDAANGIFYLTCLIKDVS